MNLEQEDLYIPIGETRIHCIRAGPATREPVLLLHGFPEFWWAWRNQIGVLAQAGFQVVAIDLKGYGESDAPAELSAYRLDRLVEDIVALADALGWSRFNIVGHDWGGIISWAVAARHPLLISRLVILNAPHLDMMSPVVLRRPLQLLRSSYIFFFQLPFVPEIVLAASRYKLLKRGLTSTSRPGTFSEETLSRYEVEWSRPGRLRAMIAYYRALVRQERDLLGRIVPPTLILWGCKDQALDFELAKSSLLQCANGRMSVHNAATHWLHLEEPDWVNSHLMQFLAEDHELDRPDTDTYQETD